MVFVVTITVLVFRLELIGKKQTFFLIQEAMKCSRPLTAHSCLLIGRIPKFDFLTTSCILGISGRELSITGCRCLSTTFYVMIPCNNNCKKQCRRPYVHCDGLCISCKLAASIKSKSIPGRYSEHPFINVYGHGMLWEVYDCNIEFMQFAVNGEEQTKFWYGPLTSWKSQSAVDTRAPCVANHRDV